MSFIALPIVDEFPIRCASSNVDNSNTEEPPPTGNTTEPAKDLSTESGTDLETVGRSALSACGSLHLVNIRVISPDQTRTNPRNLTLRKIRNLLPNSRPNLPPNSHSSN